MNLKSEVRRKKSKRGFALDAHKERGGIAALEQEKRKEAVFSRCGHTKKQLYLQREDTRRRKGMRVPAGDTQRKG